jgi:hypothetical protein
MLLSCPLVPLTATTVAVKMAALQATVLLLLTLLIKARIQIKTASAVGLLLLSLQTLAALAAVGGLGLTALGAVALAARRRSAPVL